MRSHRNTVLLLVILVMSLNPLASTQAYEPPGDRSCESAFNALLNANPDSPSADKHKKQLVSKGCNFSNVEVEITDIEVLVSAGLVRWDVRVTNSGALTVTDIVLQDTIDGVTFGNLAVGTLDPGASIVFGGGIGTLAPGPHIVKAVITQAVRDDYGADDVATAYFTVIG